MSNLPPIMRDQRKADADHLNLLGIFHFVAAGLSLLGVLFVVAHFTMVQFFLGNPKLWEGQKAPPPPAEIFVIFKWIYLAMGCWFLLSLVLNVISGIFIRTRKNRLFSLITAAVNCLHIPLGTVLGVFTIVVLIRDSVRDLYDAQEAGQRRI